MANTHTFIWTVLPYGKNHWIPPAARTCAEQMCHHGWKTIMRNHSLWITFRHLLGCLGKLASINLEMMNLGVSLT